LASWQGWIKIGFLDSFFNKKSAVTNSTSNSKSSTSANKNDSQRKTDLAAIKAALKTYYAKNAAYPIAEKTQKTSDADTALKALVPDFIAKLPVDPNPANYYSYKSDGKTFEMTCVLEDKSDLNGITVGNILIYKVTNDSSETPTSSNNSVPASTSTGSSSSVPTPSSSSSSTVSPSSSSSSQSQSQSQSQN